MTEEQGCGFHAQMKKKEEEEQAQMRERLSSIRNKILILSGKGGVGKSTFAVNLAVSLALSGKKVGLLDIDVHGPSIPKLLGMEGRSVLGEGDAILPVEYDQNLHVMSIGFLLQDREEAVIWRGPMKHSLIKQFLTNVKWGNLDYLVVDSPPGTGDEPLTIGQYLARDARAVIVTTPQEIALADVRKSVLFCRKLNLPIVGIVENMSGFICPHCGEVSEIFKSGGGEALARGMEVPFLGRIPIDPGVVNSSDEGKPYVDAFADSETAKAFGRVIEPILEQGA